MASSAVRPEYEALSRDMEHVAAHFGLVFDEAMRADLASLARTFETIDRHVDATPTSAARAVLCARIVGALRDGPGPAVLDPELAERLAWVRGVYGDRTGAFADELARFFGVSERLRTTSSRRTYISCVLGEARCASTMTLMLDPRLRGAEFARFFEVLSEVANLVDKLHDVRDDRRRGEIAIRPGVRVHARLAGTFAARSARLLRMSPRPLELARWGARYLREVTPAEPLRA